MDVVSEHVCEFRSDHDVGSDFYFGVWEYSYSHFVKVNVMYGINNRNWSLKKKKDEYILISPST